MTIATERLDLVPLDSQVLRWALSGEFNRIANHLEGDVSEDFACIKEVARLRLAQLEENPEMLCWLLRGMLLRSSRQLVGHIGFHTAPDPDYLRDLAPGGVEFGYTVYPSFRRQGYARESVTALMQWAQAHHGITRFVVSIRPDNGPSLALASQLGFRRIGEHVDEVDGLEYILSYDALRPEGS